MNDAEELHKESLEILAKLASRTAEKLEEHNVISNYKVTHTLKGKNSETCVNCFQENCNGTCDKENAMLNKGMQTPQKERNQSDPVTPTANLKMLVCAASVLTPATNGQDERRNLFSSCDFKENLCNQQLQDAKTTAETMTTLKYERLEQLLAKGKKGQQLLGRKEKSLGLLCKKFLVIYPEYSENGTTILLDDVVKELGIGRRRVYDIVNVLESMEMMIRQAKNKYLWYGKSRLRATLTKLKALALRVYGKHFCNVQSDYKLKKVVQKEDRKTLCPLSVLTNSSNIVTNENNEYNQQSSQPDQQPPLSSSCEDEDMEDTDKEYDDVTSSIMDYIISNESVKKEHSRSLGILCQKFIMLFMVAEDNIVTLDKAARILLNESDEGPAKYKTKVRRLYDIANILTSIEFLEKTNSYVNASKKAAYKWVGLDLKTLDSEDGIKRAFQSLEFSVTRHSLLAQVPKKPSDLASNSTRKMQCRSASAHQLTINKPGKFDDAFKSKFPRTYSAAAVGCSKENLSSDGFDISQLEHDIIEEGVRSAGSGNSESPTQALFKEKLRKLQEEFPDKLPNSGLIDLIKATKNQVVNIAVSIAPQTFIQDGKKRVQAGGSVGVGLRRSLSGEFDENGAVCSPAKKIKIELYPQQQQQTPDQGTIQRLPILKSIGSFVGSPNGTAQPQHKVLHAPRIQIVTSEQASLINSIKAAAAAVASGQQQQQKFNIGDTRQAYRPLLISNTLPLASKVNGGANVFQIIPIQCKPLKTVQHDKQIHAVPLVLNHQHQPQTGGAASSTNQGNNNVLTMLMRQPLVTVNSPTVLLSPRKHILKKSAHSPVADTLTTQQIAEKYPEYFTPPNHMRQIIGGGGGVGGKPAANPIIFPKMTPETPSSEPKGALNAVTRKLMSFQNEEEQQHG